MDWRSEAVFDVFVEELTLELRNLPPKGSSSLKLKINHTVGILTIFALAATASAQTLVDTVPAGLNPGSIAINPVTNVIYVANEGGGDVTVLDGSTDQTSSITIGGVPNVVAVNPTSNKIYVGNGSNITVIDGADNSTTTIAVGNTPSAIAVNPVTGKIYVANRFSNNVTVIDGGTSTTATVSTGMNPTAVALDQVSNKIFVANSGDGTVTVINGADNSTTLVIVGGNPQSAAVNPVTGKVYIGNTLGETVTILDANSNSIITAVPGVARAGSLVVNPVTNQVYFTDSGNPDLSVIDGTTNTSMLVALTGVPATIAVNATDGTVCVPLVSTDQVQLLEPLAGPSLNVGVSPVGVAVNPLTNRIYVANRYSDDVSVIDGATYPLPGVNGELSSAPGAAILNPVNDKLYVVNAAVNAVTVIDGTTGTFHPIPVGNSPQDIAVNPLTNLVYVTNDLDSTVSVIDGSTDAVSATVPVSAGPFAIGVNAATNEVYVASPASDSVTVIDGATNNTRVISMPGSPFRVAVNPATNRIYVSVQISSFSNAVYMIDGNSKAVIATSISEGQLVIDATSNRLYRLIPSYINNNAALEVIDGASNAVLTHVLLNGPANVTAGDLLALDAPDHKIYAANEFNGQVSIVNAVSDSIESTLELPSPLNSISVNPTSGKAYLTYAPGVNGDQDFKFSVVDGVSNSFFTVSYSQSVNALVPSPLNDQLLILGTYASGLNDFTLLPEQQQQAIPLKVIIGPLPSNALTLPNGNITLTSSSSYAPTAPAPQRVYYQLDSRQGQWLPASGTAPNFTATLSSVAPGIHTIFAYATDGEDGTTINAGSPGADFSSPIIGAISAYVFAVLPQSTQTAVQLVSGSNPSVYGQSLMFQATVTATGSTPSGSVAFLDDGVVLGTATLNSSGTTTFNTSLVGTGTRSITAVYLGGGTLAGSVSAPIVQTVSKATTTTAAVVLSSGNNPSEYGSLLQFSTAVSPQFAGTPTGTVTFMDGGNAIGMATLNSGSATISTNALNAGPNSIVAVYGGDGNFLGSDSSSAPLPISVTPAVTGTNLLLSTGPNFFYGQTISLAATVYTPFHGTFTGTVTLKEGTAVLQSIAPDTFGRAAFALQGVITGPHTYIAYYSGDNNNSASNSAALTLTVQPATVLVSATATPGVVHFRQSATVTVTVAPLVSGGTGATPTGTVDLENDNQQPIGTANLDSSGAASFGVTQLPIGQDILIVQYQGDSNYNSGRNGLAIYHSPRPR